MMSNWNPLVLGMLSHLPPVWKYVFLWKPVIQIEVRAGRSKREPLPSTWLLLLLKILVKTPFLSSTPLNCLEGVQWPPLLMLLTIILIGVFCPGDSFLHLSRLWLTALWWGQYFCYQILPRTAGSWVLFWPYKVTDMMLKVFLSVQLKLEGRAHLQRKPGDTEQPKSGLSALTSLTCVSAAH